MEMDMSPEEEDSNLPSTSSVQLNDESSSGDKPHSSSENISPPRNSPSSPTVVAKENILHAKISGFSGDTVEDMVSSLLHALNDPEYDAEPLVPLLFSSWSGGNLRDIAVRKGYIKVHHLLQGEKWTSVVSDMIAHIGICKLMDCLRQSSIPHSVLLKSLLKDISKEIDLGELYGVLNATDVLEYVTKVHPLPDVVKAYNMSPLRRDPYYVISPTPSNASEMINNLSIVEIGEHIKRCAESRDLDLFLDTLFDKVRVNRNLHSVPKDMIVSCANTAETLNDAASSFTTLNEGSEGTENDSEFMLQLEELCLKMTPAQMVHAFCKLTKKRMNWRCE